MRGAEGKQGEMGTKKPTATNPLSLGDSNHLPQRRWLGGFGWHAIGGIWMGCDWGDLDGMLLHVGTYRALRGGASSAFRAHPRRVPVPASPTGCSHPGRPQPNPTHARPRTSLLRPPHPPRPTLSVCTFCSASERSSCTRSRVKP